MSTGGAQHFHRRLRISGVLIILGLVVELLSLIRIHPLAFMGFLVIGGGLLLAGVVLYLFSLVSVAGPPPTESAR
jgi:hypothetical protein